MFSTFPNNFFQYFRSVFLVLILVFYSTWYFLVDGQTNCNISTHSQFVFSCFAFAINVIKGDDAKPNLERLKRQHVPIYLCQSVPSLFEPLPGHTNSNISTHSLLSFFFINVYEDVIKHIFLFRNTRVYNVIWQVYNNDYLLLISSKFCGCRGFFW